MRTGPGGELAALHAELARAFDWWNAKHWRSKLPKVAINFHPQPANGNRLGHYAPGAWTIRVESFVSDDGSRSATRDGDEIVFYADLCLKRGMTQVLETLVHEMCHLWQQHHGKPGKRNFHNAQWHREAARVGLVTVGDARGSSAPGAGFVQDLAAFAPRVEGVPFRKQSAGRGGGSKLRKWTCACGYGVRVAIPFFQARCLDCGEVFETRDDLPS